MFVNETLLETISPTFLLVVSTFVLIYWYSTRNFDYWKKRGIPYAKPYPFIGSLWDTFKKPLHDVEGDRYAKFGPIYGHFEKNSPALTVADPDLIRNIFIKDFSHFTNRRSFSTGEEIVDSLMSFKEGEDWKRIRSILLPIFTTSKAKLLLDVFKDTTKFAVNNFKKDALNKKPSDTHKIYGAFIMDSIASSAFSIKIDSHDDPNNEFASHANTASEQFGYRISLLVMFPFLMRLFKVPIFPLSATRFFKGIAEQIIEERRRTGEVRDDFLQMLMNTANIVEKKDFVDKTKNKSSPADITSNYGEDESSYHMAPKYPYSKTLTIEEMVGQIILLFLGGYDTTGMALSCTTYLLAHNEHVQEKVYAEVKEAFHKCQGNMTYETIQSMTYLDNVISETLRLYPPSVRIERCCNTDYKLGDTGITIPKGMIIYIPNYNIQRDPKYFPDPEKFDPDRFSPSERTKMTPYTYLPFGSGPRNCIGMRFALMEMKIILAYVIGSFKIKPLPNQKPLKFKKGKLLLVAEEIKVQMELREDQLFK